MLLNDNTVAQRFDRGASRYDELALVQHRVANRLLRLVLPDVRRAHAVVDLGCGTGRLLAQCRDANKVAKLTGVDISTQMLAQVAKQSAGVRLVQASLDNTGLESKGYDLVLSSSALQWAELSSAAREISRISSFNGTVAIACFLDGTLTTWRGLWPGQHQTLPLQEALLTALINEGLSIIDCHTELIVDHQPDFNAALASVKGVGAGGNTIKQTGFVGQRALRNAQKKVTQMVVQEGGFPMEYKVLYLIAKNEGLSNDVS